MTRWDNAGETDCRIDVVSMDSELTEDQSADIAQSPNCMQSGTKRNMETCAELIS